jgi:hypothetical protein
MKTLLRVLGIWLLLAGLIALAVDATRSLAGSGQLVLTPLGAYWYKIDPGSLNLFQAGVERHVHPYLWDPVILSILELPAFAVLCGVGVVLYWLGRMRKRVEVFSN